MSGGLVSIIIPIYNSRSFLASCIDSVLRQSQSYQDIEVVLVNDGSTDDSEEICLKYADDIRVRYYKQDNRGANEARRKGVEISSGEWIMFVDSDDILETDSIKMMLELSDNTDIVVGCPQGAINYFKHYREQTTHEEYELMVYSREVSVAPFAKLFRKSLFNDNTFHCPDFIILGEDYLMNLQLAISNKRNVVFLKKEVYLRRYNPRSLIHTNTLTADYCETICKLADGLLSEKISLPQYIKARVHQRLVFYYLLLRDVDYRIDVSHPFIRHTHEMIVRTGYGGMINKLMTSSNKRAVIKNLRNVERLIRRIKYPPLFLDDIGRFYKKHFEL